MLDEKKLIVSKFILDEHLGEDGSLRITNQVLDELGISPNDLFRAYLNFPETKEPTKFLMINQEQIVLNYETAELLIDRIRRNPKMSPELRQMLYRRNKDFYKSLRDELLRIMRTERLSKKEERNLLQFLEEKS